MTKPLNAVESELKEDVQALLDKDYPEAYVQSKPKLNDYRQKVLAVLQQFNDDTPLKERKALRSQLEDYQKELRGDYSGLKNLDHF